LDLTGTLLWKFDCNPPTATNWTMANQGTRSFFFATPTATGNEIYVGLNHSLEGRFIKDRPVLAIRVTRKGNRYKAVASWTFKHEELYSNGTFSSVAAGRTAVFSLCQDSAYLLALNRKTGKLLWTCDIGDTAVSHGFPSPVIHGGQLFVPAENEIYILRAARKKHVIGRIEFDSLIKGTPLIDGKTLFIASGQGVVKALDLSAINDRPTD